MANYDASTLVNAAYEQVTGQKAIDALSIEDIIDQGVSSGLFETQREQFTKALIEQCTKTLYTDGMYAESYDDPYYVDSRRFGSITQVISIEAPEAKENPSWESFVEGTSKLGVYDVTIPVIASRLFAKSSSWSIEICLTGQQWDPAFRDADELRNLVDFIMVSIQNAIMQHKEDMNAANRASFIGQKILAQNAVGNTGVHVIELRSAYNSARGKSIATKEAFLADADAMRWAAKTITLYADYMKKQSVLFNTSGKVKFVPKDRLVIELNTGFERSIEEVALSDTYHDEMIRIAGGNFHTVPYWQGEKTANGTLDFEATTSISVKYDKDTTVEQSGIVAFLCDKYAIMHTEKSNRVASFNDEIRDVQLFSYQFRDQYMNNLDLPALVFTLEDPSEP